MEKQMRTLIAAAVLAMLALVAVATPDLSVSQPVRASDGYGDVGHANALGAEGKWDEGRAFVAKLRALPLDKRNLEERQSVDMAEFALLRYNLDANKERCIECLKAVYDACSTSFWGWPSGFPTTGRNGVRLGEWGTGNGRLICVRILRPRSSSRSALSQAARRSRWLSRRFSSTEKSCIDRSTRFSSRLRLSLDDWP